MEFQEYFDGLRTILNERFSLSDYLIKPVQRITKYGLILKSLNEYLAKEGFDKSSALERSIRIMTGKKF